MEKVPAEARRCWSISSWRCCSRGEEAEPMGGQKAELEQPKEEVESLKKDIESLRNENKMLRE
eukprot:10179302-Alexandrium_andersonii.AAC.1